MKAQDVIKEIEDCNDDFYGLYEIIWGLNTRFPAIKQDEKISLSQTVVLDMLDKGKINLYQTTWANPVNDAKRISKENLRSTVLNDKSWQAPSEAVEHPYIVFETVN